MEDMYRRLIRLLDDHQAHYRLIDHPAEGRTEIVSPMRGHDVRCAAKCMVLIVKLGRKTTRYILAVVPGDRRVDFAAVKNCLGASYVSFANAETAERLGGSMSGTILPFTFAAELELIVDPAVFESPTLYFNAARLDQSVALETEDYKRIAQPRLEHIAERRAP